jgi:thiosulfate/3-mercaptopyruvate sulfurtransferase
MAYTAIINPADLAGHLGAPGWVILDCRFSLQDTEKGQRDYLRAHIPGAGYLHLDRDLSGAVVPGKTGRHPLPEAETARQTFARVGIHPGVQVVAYDDAGGSLAAARAWWLLRWLGFESAAVLDGGWQAWVEAGFDQQSGLAQQPGEDPRGPAVFRSQPRPELAVSGNEVDWMRVNPAYRVVDARSADRYRGENETIDPVAGHIPGAINAPYKDVLSATGKLISGEDLRAYYLKLLDGVEAGQAVFYCGSGVTASLHILAMLHAGLGEARLYAGSWSEWITDAQHPVVR